jgi:hypothetical protein
VRREPNFVIGPKDDPYLLRWWIIPRNRWFNIYLHKIMRPDDDRALHDHPWASLSIILKGGYYEVMPCGCTEHCSGTRQKWRKPGTFVFRRAEAAHRLMLHIAAYATRWNFDVITGHRPVYRPCWSLFLTGPRIREWGFHCPKGWVKWTDFVAKDDAGAVGRGCGD